MSKIIVKVVFKTVADGETCEAEFNLAPEKVVERAKLFFGLTANGEISAWCDVQIQREEFSGWKWNESQMQWTATFHRVNHGKPVRIEPKLVDTLSLWLDTQIAALPPAPTVPECDFLPKVNHLRGMNPKGLAVKAARDPITYNNGKPTGLAGLEYWSAFSSPVPEAKENADYIWRSDPNTVLKMQLHRWEFMRWEWHDRSQEMRPVFGHVSHGEARIFLSDENNEIERWLAEQVAALSPEPAVSECDVPAPVGAWAAARLDAYERS